MPRRSTLRLTTRIVDRLQVDDKDAIFWDRDLAGFGVRVHATGRKVYVVQSRGPAGLKRVTLGPVAGLPFEQRRREAAEVIDRIKRGEDPLPPAPAPEPTVADLALQCLTAHVAVHCKPRTAEAYRTALDNHILPAFGTMLLKDVGRKEVGALHHRLRDTPAMANRVVWILSKMFSLAEAWEMMPTGRNPCRAVRLYKEQSRDRFLTPEEFRRVGTALRDFEADGSMWPPTIAALRLLMLTGCRKSEILTLRWEEVDLDAGEIHLAETKTGARTVQLPPSAVRLLEALPRRAGSSWVLPGNRPETHMSGIDTAWRTVRAQAGLNDLRIHDLRHSFASRALALGETLPVIGKLLGHSDIETTARYAHLARDSIHEAAERIADSISADIV